MGTAHTIIDSPVGDLTLVAERGALVALYFPHHAHEPDSATFGARVDPSGTSADAAVLAEATRQLGEYFSRQRSEFTLPLAARGDAFQQRVWSLLREIPYGETRSYGQLAAALGDPNLARAVGSANGRNPLSIVVPCHRVIGSDGRLVGYGGGLERKIFLLELEESAQQRAQRLF